MNAVVRERVTGQHAPSCPMVARGKFEDGEIHVWDVLSAISIERIREDGSRDTVQDVTIILDSGHIALFSDAIDEMPGGVWAEWEIVPKSEVNVRLGPNVVTDSSASANVEDC